MKTHYSILHISDLHKPENCNLNNLFYSLQTDCEVYTGEGICKPEIIVVSGDVVEGSKEADAESIIKSQYVDAGNFLAQLTDYFLEGDRSRVIIVPGNHDYCYTASKNSMTLSVEEKLNEDYNRFKEGDHQVRWNWKERRYYHITNWERYAQRYDLFKAFYNDFYKGIREIPEQVDKDSYIVELPSYGIAFVCFNSCYRLDHLNPMGCICPDAISNAHERLVQLKNMGHLLVGVWHHHVSGLPVENNYMDYRILNAMMREDIKVGLFGHQHISTAVQEYSDITSKQSILLISSGSLYGNRYQLVTGVPRQYNVIELTFNKEDVTLELNVRKDNSQYGYDIPQWIQQPIGINSLYKYSHHLRVEKSQIEYVIADIDKTVKQTGDYGVGCRRLLEIGLDNDLALKFFDSYIPKVAERSLLKDFLQHPLTMVQYMTALDAAVSMRDVEWIRGLIFNEKFASESNPYINELRNLANKMI